MQQNDFELLTASNGAPIKRWTHGVPVEPEAQAQLLDTAKMPFIFKHLAVMPDVHLGKGSTIGSVIPTKGGNYSCGGWRGYWLRDDCRSHVAGGR